MYSKMLSKAHVWFNVNLPSIYLGDNVKINRAVLIAVVLILAVLYAISFKGPVVL